MPNPTPSHVDLQSAAKEVMHQHGFNPDFPASVTAQLANLRGQSQITATNSLRDMRSLLWSSIDNDTSRDLDQIEVAEGSSDGGVKLMIGIADVDTFVPKLTPIDQHAARETTTVYTGICNFPMLPEELSTGITSLLEGQDRVSVVIEFLVDSEGNLKSSDIYRALVRNPAQLHYNSVGDWLEGKAAPPPKVAACGELQRQLKLQSDVAQKLKQQRFQHGALNLQTDEVHPLVLNEKVIDVVKQQKNHATELIEDFMVAANGVERQQTVEAQARRSGHSRWIERTAMSRCSGRTQPIERASIAAKKMPIRFAGCRRKAPRSIPSGKGCVRPFPDPRDMVDPGEKSNTRCS